MPAVKILFVDDEPGICLTMPAILEHHGFEVTAVGAVDEALSKITSEPFDVLISDLNIGHPGDGFVVVSAMRRTQPHCITLILTGYPGFETALQAIRSQVDDYLVKPAPIPTLVALIEEKLSGRRPGQYAATKRIPDLLRESAFEITQRTLKEMKSDPVLGKLPLSDEERIGYVSHALKQLAEILELPEEGRRDAILEATRRAKERYLQGCPIPVLAANMRLLQKAILDVIQENLLSINLSYLMFDLKRLTDVIGLQLEHSVTAYLEDDQSQISHGHSR